jgi:hypothetical protein
MKSCCRKLCQFLLGLVWLPALGETWYVPRHQPSSPMSFIAMYGSARSVRGPARFSGGDARELLGSKPSRG